MENCRPNAEWDTCYNLVSGIQVHQLDLTLDKLIIFALNSDATKDMDNFLSDTNMARTIDAELILFESKGLVFVELAEEVQLNRKLIPKTPSPTSSHPVIRNIIQTQKNTLYGSILSTQYGVCVNPAFDTIKT
jgi:hypothetical protein